MSEFVTQLEISAFDRTLLPESDRSKENEELALAIQKYFEEKLQNERGFSEVVITPEYIKLRWSESPNPANISDRALDRLVSGDLSEGIRLLEIALATDPDNAQILYNLGMALSDAKILEAAVNRLERLTNIQPENARGWVALGVAYARSGDVTAAIEALRKSVELDATDPYALKNLGALMVEAGIELDVAKNFLEAASKTLSDDQQIWLSLGRVSEKLDLLDDSDEAYIKTIELNPYNPIAEAAKEGRSRIASLIFKEKGGGFVRPDAVMYCLGALQRFDGKSKSEVQKLTFEIATLGMRGLDVNSPEEKYSVQSLPGKFSGLHLLCIEYVGFKILDGSVDIGFDLSIEYAQALSLHENRRI